MHDTYASNDTNQDHLIYVSEAFNGVIQNSLLVNSPNGRGVKLARPTPATARRLACRALQHVRQ